VPASRWSWGPVRATPTLTDLDATATWISPDGAGTRPCTSGTCVSHGSRRTCPGRPSTATQAHGLWTPLRHLDRRRERASASRHLAPERAQPFNPATRIEFDCRRDSRGASRDRLRPAGAGSARCWTSPPGGSHAVVWRGEDDAGRPVPAGIYLYRLRSAAGSAVGKMSLVR
jgi:hypothetical protein